MITEEPRSTRPMMRIAYSDLGVQQKISYYTIQAGSAPRARCHMKYEKSRTTGQTFDGLTADTGLFQPGNATGNTGDKRFQVRINAIRFSVDGAAVAFAYETTDPDDSSKGFELFSGTGSDLSDDTYRMLTTNDDGKSWAIRFTTGTLTGDATVLIDYDIIRTEG